MKTARRERVILLGTHRDSGPESVLEMKELTGLVDSAGGTVIAQVNQRRPEKGRQALPGKGKLAELAAMCLSEKADLVVTNQDLSPIQLKVIEDAVPCRVVDRTSLILDIFAQRARSREGQLQVELAQHLYRLPRLRGVGKEMSRLGASLGGGLGTRGPGEQKLEYDRRRIRNRISLLKREIEGLRERRGQQRARRREMQAPSLVLVGYTNAGKSTLFNAVSRGHAATQPTMFSTLDPQVRQLHLPGGGRVLISDTVGFIDELPKNLRVAFRATLEEIAAADILIHVVDASHPQLVRQIAAVREELKIMGADGIPCLTVMNKMDRVDNRGFVEPLASELAPSAMISARERHGIESMLATLEELMREKVWIRVTFEDPTVELKMRIAAMGVSTREIRRQQSTGGGEAILLETWLSPANAARLEKEQAR